MQRQRGHHISEAQRAAVEAILRQGKHASEAARETGIGARTCERIRRQLLGEAAKKPKSLGGSAADREIVRLRDEVASLKRALTESHRETLSEDAIKILLGRVAAAPADPPDWLAEAPPRTSSIGRLMASAMNRGQRSGLGVPAGAAAKAWAMAGS